jgi:type VI secretion system protein ImpA
MPEPRNLDLTVLLSPIPGNDPAGNPLADDVRRKLDDLRREPDEFEKMSGAQDKKADWRGVIDLAEETLTGSSKDLLVAARLAEALTKTDGFPGFLQGLNLLTQLVTDCWDRIHPKPEGEDYTSRIGSFRWLNDANRGAKFPSTIANLQLFKKDETVYSFVYVAANAKPSQREEFERVFDGLKVADLQQFRKTAEAVRASYQALQALGKALDGKLAENAPDLVSQENPDNLGRTLQGVVECVDRLMKKSGLEGVAAKPGSGTDGESSDKDGGNSVESKQASREALYQKVGEIAEVLNRLEPHSPIPYLLKRIVRLGALPFPDLMRELVRERSTIDEFDRLLGIPKKGKEE